MSSSGTSRQVGVRKNNGSFAGLAGPQPTCRTCFGVSAAVWSGWRKVLDAEAGRADERSAGPVSARSGLSLASIGLTAKEHGESPPRRILPHSLMGSLDVATKAVHVEQRLGIPVGQEIIDESGSHASRETHIAHLDRRRPEGEDAVPVVNAEMKKSQRGNVRPALLDTSQQLLCRLVEDPRNAVSDGKCCPRRLRSSRKPRQLSEVG